MENSQLAPLIGQPQAWLEILRLRLLATAVLNINNLRDIDSDRLSGKFTLGMRLGPLRARHYHRLLLTAATICLACFTLLDKLHPAG